MSVIHVDKDPEARTLTIAAEFGAAVERVWRLWAEPGQLARWWGPPQYPATVTTHELRPGGEVAYYVTGPDGERATGSWRIIAVEPPRRLKFEFRDPRVPPLEISVEIAARDGGGTRMTTTISFPSDAAMDELLSIGFEQGMATAIRQAAEVLES